MSSNGTVGILQGSSGWLALQLEQLRGEAEEWVRLRADERQPGQIYEELRSYSFFGLPRTVIVEDADRLDEESWAELEEGLGAVAPHLRVWITVGTGRSAGKILERLQDAAPDAELISESGGGRKQLAPANFPKVALTRELEELMQELLGDDPMLMTRELQKLSLLDSADPIEVETWRALSDVAAAVDGFRFARAVMQRDLVEAESILQSWKHQGGTTHTVSRDLMGAVGYVLRQFLVFRLKLATGSAPAQAAKATPGRFTRQDQAVAKTWTIPQLADAMSQLVKLDRELKSTRIPAEIQLFAWCVRSVQTGRSQAV